MNFLPSMVLCPGSIPGVMILLCSPSRGIGKGTLYKVRRALLGANLVLKTSNPQVDVFGNYNSARSGKIVVFLDEMDIAHLGPVHAQLK